MLNLLIMVFVTTFVVLLLGYQYVDRRRQAVKQRLLQYAQPEQQRAIARKAGFSGGFDWRSLSRYLSQFFSSQSARSLDEKMIRAGLPLRGSEFLGLSVGTSLFAGLVFIALARGQILGGMLMAAVVYWFFQLYMNIKISRRQQAFNEQLADALSLMANAMRSGFSIYQTMEMVAKEMPDPASDVFSRCMREMNLGVATEDAIGNLNKWIGSNDLDLAVTAILIQRQTGGNLAQLLDNIAATIRERTQLKWEVNTLTAQGRLSGIIVGALPFVICAALFVINPDYIQPLFTEPVGQTALAVALMLQAIGILVIRRICNIEM